MQKKIAYGGVASALCIILLAMSSYLPTLKAATLFAASVIPYAVCKFLSVKTAFLMYGATAILAFIICQSGSPEVAFSFGICFGNYPVFAAILERKSLSFSFISKILLYTIYFIAVYLVFTKLLLISLPWSPLILFALGIIVFAVYDYLIKRTGNYLLYILERSK